MNTLNRHDFPGVQYSDRIIQVIYDAVGGELATYLLQNLKSGADFVSYGLLSGQPYAFKDVIVHPQRFHLRDTLDSQEWQQWFVELWEMLATCQLPEVRTFGPENWRAALQEFSIAGRRFKPALTM